MEVGFRTDKGKKRTNNEDACYVLLPEKAYVICDGVGGGNSGEIASRTAVSEIAGYIMDKPISSVSDKYELVNYLQDALEHANSKIFEMANNYVENTGMATTCVVLHIAEDKAYIANIGDSRAYIFRDGQLCQLTEDHTYVNTLVKAGILSKEEAEVDERKNVITRALGAEVSVEPDYFQVDIFEGDIFVICTDGLYDEVESAEMVEILNKRLSMSDTAYELIARANENGGHDNITVICLRVTEEDIDE